MYTSYSDYLHSPKWKEIREIHLEENPKCYVCGTTLYPQVHHITYENIGNEQPHELITLCDNHHSALHNKVRKKKLLLENAHLILRKRYLNRKPRTKNKKHKKSKTKKLILDTKVSKETKNAIRHVLLGCISISRHQLYDEVTKKLGIEKLNEVKHAVWDMIKRDKIMKISHNLVCINPKWIYNPTYRR